MIVYGKAPVYDAARVQQPSRPVYVPVNSTVIPCKDIFYATFHFLVTRPRSGACCSKDNAAVLEDGVPRVKLATQNRGGR